MLPMWTPSLVSIASKTLAKAAAIAHGVFQPLALLHHRRRVAAAFDEARDFGIVQPAIAALEVVGLEGPQPYEFAFQHIVSSG